MRGSVVGIVLMMMQQADVGVGIFAKGVSLAGASPNINVVATTCLPRQNTSLVATKVCLSRQKFVKWTENSVRKHGVALIHVITKI